MAVSATTKNLKGSAQKYRRVVNVIRGQRVEEALSRLAVLPSPMAATVAKVVRSAAANAESNEMMDPRALRIVRAYADEGPRIRRFHAQARGRVHRILKRRTHITIVVDEEA
jgi:large subunit ribosomal protein L22